MFRNIKDKIDTFQAKRFENYVKKLSESDKMRDIEKFKELMNSEKLNLEDEKILNYVITWHAHRFLSKLNCSQKEIKWDVETNKYCGKFSYEAINSLLKKGISIEKMMQNSEIERELINSFLTLKNSELTSNYFEHPLFMAPKLEVMGEIIKIPEYKEIIQNSLDIQKYGEKFFCENFRAYKNEYLGMYQSCAAFLLELGYVPFKNKDKITFLICGNRSIEMQKYYNCLGLIDKKTTSKLYQIRFEELKNAYDIASYFYRDKKAFPIFSELEIDNQDEMANYWKNMSDLLNMDSMVLVLVEIFQTASGLFEKEEYIQRCDKRSAFCEQQFTNGIPNSNFFNGEVIHSFIKKVIDSKNQRELEKKLLPFFIFNIEQIKGSNKGFFKVLQKLEQVHEDLKADLQETFLSFVGYFSKIDTYFNENGVTPIFYEDIKYQDYNKLLSYIDCKWEQHYTPKNANLIKSTIKCPRLFYFNHLTDISRFFDENGFTEEFYSYGYFHLDFCTIISKLDPNWEQYFNPSWIRCIRFLCRYPQHEDKLLSFLKNSNPKYDFTYVVFGQDISDEKVIDLFQYKNQKNLSKILECLVLNDMYIQDTKCNKLFSFIQKYPNYQEIIFKFIEIANQMQKNILIFFFEILSESEMLKFMNVCLQIKCEKLQEYIIGVILNKWDMVLEDTTYNKFIEFSIKYPQYQEILFMFVESVKNLNKVIVMFSGKENCRNVLELFEKLKEEQAIKLLDNCMQIQYERLQEQIIDIIVRKWETILGDVFYEKLILFIQKYPKYQEVLSNFIKVGKQISLNALDLLFERLSEEEIVEFLNECNQIKNPELCNLLIEYIFKNYNLIPKEKIRLFSSLCVPCMACI